LRTHIEAVLTRLTVLRGSDRLEGVADVPLADAVRAIEPLLHQAEHARGDQRQRVLDGLAAAERQLLSALDASLAPETRAEYEAEAVRELEPFRARMSPDAYQNARRAVIRQRIRERYGLPEISA
jgi:hypothetical protein